MSVKFIMLTDASLRQLSGMLARQVGASDAR
jgi:hypothetical protein